MLPDEPLMSMSSQSMPLNPVQCTPQTLCSHKHRARTPRARPRTVSIRRPCAVVVSAHASVSAGATGHHDALPGRREGGNRPPATVTDKSRRARN
jgi:hypothetical protein